MSVASYESQSKRRRATGFLLALAVETLVIVALLLWRPGLFTKPPQQPRLTTFSVSPSPENRAANQAAADRLAKVTIADLLAEQPASLAGIKLPARVPA